MTLMDEYEHAMESPRLRLNSIFNKAFDDGMVATKCQLFFIKFSAMGVAMTEPVEDWIRRAGENCVDKIPWLGDALKRHAKHEANHHLMMISDTQYLINDWNNRGFTPVLDAATVLDQPITDGVRAYSELHENTISGYTPFAQVAIEYEIEMLSLRWGNRVMEKAAYLLGSEIISGLSFISDHSKVDIGHTEFNRKLLNNLLVEVPDYLPDLVMVGTEALRCYGAFVSDCVAWADKELTHTKVNRSA